MAFVRVVRSRVVRLPVLGTIRVTVMRLSCGGRMIADPDHSRIAQIGIHVPDVLGPRGMRR